MAAAYAFHVSKNHPFFDGNKRAALLCCGGFLRLNGWNLISEGTNAADAILQLIAGTLDKRGFGEWLQQNCRPRPSFELRDFFAAVTPKLMQALRDGSVLGPRTELAASFQEASFAIPLLQSLFSRAQDCAQRGDEQGQLAAASQIVVLQLLFRAAEDMGYEW
jgi:hypothetical protein